MLTKNIGSGIQIELISDFLVFTSKIFSKYFLKKCEIISTFLIYYFFVKYYKNIQLFSEVEKKQLKFIINHMNRKQISAKILILWNTSRGKKLLCYNNIANTKHCQCLLEMIFVGADSQALNFRYFELYFFATLCS